MLSSSEGHRETQRPEGTSSVSCTRGEGAHILMVPLGPRLDLSTSCSPLAALMFMFRAADRPRISAFWFSMRTAMATDWGEHSKSPRGTLRQDSHFSAGGRGSPQVRNEIPGVGSEPVWM